MAEPTLDELVAFMKKHGAEKVDSITDEKSAIKHFRATSRVYKQERDSLLKQRDELINDMAKLRERNAELERKLDKEVKLSYEIEGNLYDVSKERDKIINDMAEVKRKAEAWIDLKKEMVEMYPVLVNDVEITSGECEKGMLYQLGKHLRRMDELDGTHEFQNLLDDFERGSDE